MPTITILKPSHIEFSPKDGTAGVDYELEYTSKPTNQDTDNFEASNLLSIISEIGQSDNLADSIEKEMGWRRKVKIRTANL